MLNPHGFWTTQRIRVTSLLLLLFSVCHVWLFVTPWTVAHQAPLSTVSWILVKFTFIKLVRLSNHLIFCCPFLILPQSFLASGSFPMTWLFASGGLNIEGSAAATVLPMNNQGWFPLGLPGLNHADSWFMANSMTWWSGTCTWLEIGDQWILARSRWLQFSQWAK